MSSEPEQCPTCRQWVPAGALEAHRRRAHGDASCSCGCGVRLAPPPPGVSVALRYASPACFEEHSAARLLASKALGEYRAQLQHMEEVLAQLG